METDKQYSFGTVVSSFQIRMLVSFGELCGRCGQKPSLEVLYNLPATGSHVSQGVGWPASGMPFELCVIARAKQLAIDVYPAEIVAYETVNEKFEAGGWQLRCEIDDFSSADECSRYVMEELKGQMRRLGCDQSTDHKE